MNHYDTYNREERAICAHLFRLLHEQLHLKEKSPLGQFLSLLSKAKLEYSNGTPEFRSLKYKNVAIYCEAAIIRDKYYNSKTKSKPDVNDFMDKLTKLLMKQEEVEECTLYSQLPSALNDIRFTHPKQIRHKADEKGIFLTKDEMNVYGAMQGMFNAKPDLVITIDNLLLVCEAKFTEKFDDNQISRTRKIAEVWAELLYESFGFTEKPIYTVFKLGAAKSNPDVSWEEVSEIAERTYPEDDRTRAAIRSGVEILQTKPDWITPEQWATHPNVQWWENNRASSEYIKNSRPVTQEEALAQFKRHRESPNWK